MHAMLELESTLTDRYQTTVPDSVRRALRLRKRDKIRYHVQGDGTVLLTRADQQEDNDPVLDRFLQFLADDMTAHPDRVRSVDRKFVKRIKALTKGVEIDLDAPLDPANE